MKKILIVLLMVFIIIQFFPIDKTNPITNEGMDFLKIKNTPEPIAKLIRNSCYDCHSNETKYPFYSNVQPVAWLLKNHIDEGRKELNFSTFATYEPKRQAHKLEEAAEYVEQKNMPLESYTLGHSDAKLSDEQRKQLVNYFRMVQKQIQQANTL
ncbi:cytochrome C [Epilithonimonas vandammei]|uniref:Cytochrome C n=1 Tax=Epilithonimonas vandammei TaxID=2487072 RepID=A0A3G8Y2I7_9FLAO|nr:heme-binding domain-containing protein [Epilithonimonas vandammei]AZI39592.1 cytochrome C [Epilithonimonas vandammei]AZI56545.1 cytochrome C [Epilithonimonas vandammei]